MSADFEDFKSFLSDIYADTGETAVYSLARELWELIGDCSQPLEDVAAYVYEFEQENRITYDCSNFLNIIDRTVYLLENNYENAQRLYTFFIYNCELYSALSKLVLYNSDYLTDEQTQKLIPPACGFGFRFIPESREWELKPD